MRTVNVAHAARVAAETNRRAIPAFAAFAAACSDAAASEALARALHVPGGHRALLAAQRRHRRAERRRLLRALRADRG